MITLTRAAGQNQSRAAEYTGLSSDTKPTNVENGAVFIEMDTKKVYFFDAANNQWREF